MDLWKGLVDRRCYFCSSRESTRAGLCLKCVEGLKQRFDKVPPLCPGCSQPLLTSLLGDCPFCSRLPLELAGLYSLSYFWGTMQELLSLYKGGRLLELRHFFADLLAEALQILPWGDSPIVPVPPRRGKIWEKGWDQVDLLAKGLRRRGFPIINCLERLDRVPQKALTLEERRRHMGENLRIRRDRKNPLKGAKRVILLDDVFTSGATLGASAGILKVLEEREVYGLVLASVL